MVIKKCAVIMLLMLLLINAAACGNASSPSPSSQSDVPAASASAAPSVTLAPTVVPVTHKLAEGNDLCGMHLEFVGAELIQDDEMKDALRIYVDVTNISDETQSLHSALWRKAFQDSETLEFAEAFDKVKADGAAELYIRPGTILRCSEIVRLNTEAPVRIEYYDFTNEKEEIIVETFDIASLSGRPEPFFPDEVTSPDGVEGLKDKGTFDSFTVQIKKYEIIRLVNGKDGIRVYYDFLNNSDNTVVFDSDFKTIVLQDNIQLRTGYAIEQKPEDNARRIEVRPDEKILITDVYELTSESPIEVEIRYYWSDKRIGKLYKAEF